MVNVVRVCNKWCFNQTWRVHSEGDVSGVLGRGNAHYVDLNRNFPDQFIDVPNNFEPEVTHMMKWMQEYPFVLSANMHGGSLVSALMVAMCMFVCMAGAVFRNYRDERFLFGRNKELDPWVPSGCCLNIVWISRWFEKSVLDLNYLQTDPQCLPVKLSLILRLIKTANLCRYVVQITRCKVQMQCASGNEN